MHDTFRHLWPLAIPFVLTDFLGAGSARFLPNPWLEAVLLGALIGNRARTVIVRSVVQNGGSRLVWTAALGYPKSLWFTLFSPLAYVVLFVPYIMISPAVYSSGLRSAIIESALGVVLVASMLVCIAGASAMIDVVAESVPPWRAIVRWMRWSWRFKTLGSTVVIAAIYMFLLGGVSIAVRYVEYFVVQRGFWLQVTIASICDGLAATLAFMLLWHWRNAVLDRELGQDLSEALDDREQQSKSERVGVARSGKR